MRQARKKKKYPPKPKYHFNHRLLLDWYNDPPTAQQIRERVAGAYPDAHGEILAAAYIAHTQEKIYAYDLITQRAKTRLAWPHHLWPRSDDWSIWWWRKCYWPAWSNTRQYLIRADSGIIIAISLDREIPQDINCLYRKGPYFRALSIPVITPDKPEKWFGYMWRNIPDWPQVEIVRKRKVLTYARPWFMKHGIKGDYFRINLSSGHNVMLSDKQLRALAYPFTRNYPNTKLHIDPRDHPQWLALSTRYGLAMTAFRQTGFVRPAKLGEDENFP